MKHRASWSPRRWSSAAPWRASPVTQRSSSPMEAGALVGDLDCRRFECARCGEAVMICRRCDRGQRYCARECSEAARRATWRRSSARYQQTTRGKRNHAAREQRRRARLRKKMTQQGSAGEAARRLMESDLAQPAPMPAAVEAEAQRDVDPPASQPVPEEPVRLVRAREHPPEAMVRCCFCGRLCLCHGRRGAVRRRGPLSGQRRSPRLPRGSRAPPSPG